MIRNTIVAATLAVAVMGAAQSAQANTFSFNFCPGNASCNANLSEASLTFQTVDGTADVNDYTVTIRFVGTLTNTFIDSIDFTGGLQFASLPVLTSAPTPLANWTTAFDKVNNGGGCSGEISNHKFACSIATVGNGPDFAGTNEWVYSVDFLSDGLIGAGSSVNLRALFVNSDGNKVGAIMSPDGHFVSTTTTSNTETTSGNATTGNVPEPAALSLFGLALAVGARRLRKRNVQ